MNRSIIPFRKTRHFLDRQSERGISDELFIPHLSEIRVEKGKRTLVISRKLINENSELMILIDGNKMVTCFFKDFQEYISTKRREKIQIIN